MRSKENRKFLVLCLLVLLICTSCASSSQNADDSPLEFFNRRVLENPEWTLKAVTELGKYRAESICSDGEHLYVLCREQNQILKLMRGHSSVRRCCRMGMSQRAPCRGMGAGMPSTARFIRWTALIALGSTFRRG